MSENVIGRKIRMAIVWRGLSPVELSREIGKRTIEVTHYMWGDKTPDSTTLIAISEALGVSVSWLMTDLKTTDILMREGMKWRKRNFDKKKDHVIYNEKKRKELWEETEALRKKKDEKSPEEEIKIVNRIMGEMLFDIGYDLGIFEEEIIKMEKWLESHTLDE